MLWWFRSRVVQVGLVLLSLAEIISLLVLLYLMFQAVFSWEALPMDLIDRGFGAIGQWLQGVLPAGPLRSLLVDGVIAGIGGVLIFLPQILILFFLRVQ